MRAAATRPATLVIPGQFVCWSMSWEETIPSQLYAPKPAGRPAVPTSSGEAKRLLRVELTAASVAGLTERMNRSA